MLLAYLIDNPSTAIAVPLPLHRDGFLYSRNVGKLLPRLDYRRARQGIDTQLVEDTQIALVVDVGYRQLDVLGVGNMFDHCQYALVALVVVSIVEQEILRGIFGKQFDRRTGYALYHYLGALANQKVECHHCVLFAHLLQLVDVEAHNEVVCYVTAKPLNDNVSMSIQLL